MTTAIRAAAIGDEAVLAGLNRFVHDLHRARRPEHFKSTRITELTAWYKSVLERPTTRAWVAEDEGLPVGYPLAIVHDRADNPFTVARRLVEIDQVAVDLNRRRLGVARALIETAVAGARAEGIGHLETTSWSFNDDAHEVLRRLGFRPKTIRFELEPSP